MIGHHCWGESDLNWSQEAGNQQDQCHEQFPYLVLLVVWVDHVFLWFSNVLGHLLWLVLNYYLMVFLMWECHQFSRRDYWSLRIVYARLSWWVVDSSLHIFPILGWRT